MADRSYKLTLSLSDGSTINAGTITAPQGPNGANGVTFTPSVSESGVLSWTNNGGLTNPSPISIKGPKGDDAVITESDVEGWGFTRNAGTITEIKMNGESKGINGVVDLGTVLTDASKFATSAQGTNADSALSKANTNATEISTIKTTYQTKTDTTLETTSKTVVGAINEVKGTADNAVQSFEAEATIDNTTGTPTVDVLKSGEGTAPTYTFNFKHLKGADGRQGEAGKDALVYRVLEDTILKKDKTIGLFYEDKLNRIPVVNDTLLIVGSGNQYCIGTVTRVNTTTKACDIQCGTVVSTKGETGPQGVSVTNATAGTPVIDGEKTTTPITFSLSDGTTKEVNVEAQNGNDGKDGAQGADGEEALVCTVMSSLAFEPSTEIGFSLNSFNRTPKPREKFVAFSLECQYATFSVNRVTSQFAYCMTSYVVSTKGETGPQGIGVKSITSGTPTIVNDKTNTPITITLTDNTTVDLVVSAENGKDGTSATVDIVQTIGQSTTAVMSQKSVTDELNAKYEKPESGIPKSDLATSVQTSLDKADTALQSAPVTSVNGKTGAVQLGASDVGALPTSTKYVVSVNGESGEVKNIAKTNSANTFTGDQTVTGNGSVSGNLTVGGNLTVNGTTTTVDSTTLQVKDKLIEVAHGNTATLTTPAGLVAPKYDGTNSGALVFDSTGTAYVGDVTLKDGNIDVDNSDLQPLATRTGLVGGNLVQYDSSAQTLKDSGKKISDLALKTDIPNTAKHSSTQLATNTDLNTLNSSADIGWYHIGGGNRCAHKPPDVDAFGLEVGRSAGGWFYQVLTSSNASTSRGRRFMRTYTGTAWDGWKKVAVTSDIPAVNNGTLTIQKNGTDVQTFTANQSSSVTANITVPTKVSELTNDSGFITSAPANYTDSSRTPSQCTANGFWYVRSSTNSLTDANGNPFLQYHTSNDDFRILATAWSDIWVQQIATDFRSTHIYYRIRNNGTWGAWTEIAKISDIPTFSLSGTTLTITL